MDNTEINLEEQERKQKRKDNLAKLPQYRGEIPTKNNLRGLPDLKVGEIFWVQLDEMPFVVTDIKNGKVTLKALDENATVSTGISIYDLNKSLVMKEPLFDFSNTEEVQKLKTSLYEWLDSTENEFYLLYGRENHYFTLFRWDMTRKQEPLETIKECLENVGKIVSIDFDTIQDQKNVEIWIRNNDNVTLLYLMPFDNGVVPF